MLLCMNLKDKYINKKFFWFYMWNLINVYLYERLFYKYWKYNGMGYIRFEENIFLVRYNRYVVWGFIYYMTNIIINYVLFILYLLI